MSLVPAENHIYTASPLSHKQRTIRSDHVLSLYYDIYIRILFFPFSVYLKKNLKDVTPSGLLEVRLPVTSSSPIDHGVFAPAFKSDSSPPPNINPYREAEVSVKLFRLVEQNESQTKIVAAAEAWAALTNNSGFITIVQINCESRNICVYWEDSLSSNWYYSEAPPLR